MKKNKVLLCLLVIIFFLNVFVYINLVNKNNKNITPDENKEKFNDYEISLNSITLEDCKKHVYEIASDKYEGRMSGKKGNILAAEYIKKEFEKYGLPTMYDKFKIQRMNPGPNNEVGDDFTQNIYSWKEGTDPELKNEIVVVGAHMDHIGYGPRMSRSNKIAIHNGADDNASGTAALLEVAEAVSKIDLKRTVVFQAYSAEEMGLIGSRYYVNNPKFPLNNPNLSKHIVMINMDMVGFLNEGYYQSSFLDADSSVDLTNSINELDKKYNFAKKITARGGGGSDHASFYNKKIPVAFLHTGGHRFYHTPEDKAHRLNYKGLEIISKYAFELVVKVSESQEKPKFNLSSFKELPYDHDHGNPDLHFHNH
jgi:hypothetical protein